MLVTTTAPIFEETSNVNGRRNRQRPKVKPSERFQRGYSRIKDAGALPVIENLLGLNQVGANQTQSNDFPPPPPPPPAPTSKGISTTTKVVIGVLLLGAIFGGYYYFKKVKTQK